MWLRPRLNPGGPSNEVFEADENGGPLMFAAINEAQTFPRVASLDVGIVAGRQACRNVLDQQSNEWIGRQHHLQAKIYEQRLSLHQADRQRLTPQMQQIAHRPNTRQLGISIAARFNCCPPLAPTAATPDIYG